MPRAAFCRAHCPGSFVSFFAQPGSTPRVTPIGSLRSALDIAPRHNIGQLGKRPRSRLSLCWILAFGRKWFVESLRLSERRLRLRQELDRKSTRLNSSHGYISYAVFCL